MVMITVHAKVHAQSPIPREVHEQVLANSLNALDRGSGEFGHLTAIVERDRAQRPAG
jgi:hypothetical protein